MATKFAFRISEQELISALATIEKKKGNPQQKLSLEVRVELVADGIGYDIVDLQTSIVEDAVEKKEEEETDV